MIDFSASYLKQWPGLAEAVAVCPVSDEHGALLARLRNEPGLEEARLATTRGDRWLARRKIIAADGAVVAEDHEAWLAVQVASDGGDVAQTCARLTAGGYRLSQCRITSLYIVAPGDSREPYDFLQVEVVVEDEIVERDLFVGRSWRVPHTLEDLQRQADEGDPLPDTERLPVRPLAYQLRRVVDVKAWLMVADALEGVRRDAFRDRRYRVSSSTSTQATVKTPDELWPGWDRFRPKHRRFFDDWARSSAGRHRLCDHWVFDLTDWADGTGRRELTMIPMWAYNRPLAKVDAHAGSGVEVYRRLQNLDEQIGVEFGWFFYLVHGNRVDRDAGERLIRAIADREVSIPESDYRVLTDWEREPYGF